MINRLTLIGIRISEIRDFISLLRAYLENKRGQ